MEFLKGNTYNLTVKLTDEEEAKQDQLIREVILH